ncbi:MAG: hypothetical protein NTV08_19890 [Verrucomicrobia bacterium]|nr:hypothetical protein [Verrucomicrobiota bacterium]
MNKHALTIYRRLVRAIWNYSGHNFPMGELNLSDLKECISANRRALAKINKWLLPDTLEKSVFRYGINAEVEGLINMPLGTTCTHTDLLTAFGQSFSKPCCYLELGVSVGKTLWQVLQTCDPSECWAFDIEEINPVLKAQLTEISRAEWPTALTSIKKTPSSITHFTHPESGGSITYICADIFDPRAWKFLTERRFNLILSDALHSSDALDFEWDQMVRVNLFDPDETVIVWDDLDGPMNDWFVKKRTNIAKHLSIPEAKVDTAFVDGWLGTREYPHRLGFAVKRGCFKSEK